MEQQCLNLPNNRPITDCNLTFFCLFFFLLNGLYTTDRFSAFVTKSVHSVTKFLLFFLNRRMQVFAKFWQSLATVSLWCDTCWSRRQSYRRQWQYKSGYSDYSLCVFPPVQSLSFHSLAPKNTHKLCKFYLSKMLQITLIRQPI